jgi:ABC-type sulfate transport system substrate-binding protein
MVVVAHLLYVTVSVHATLDEILSGWGRNLKCVLDRRRPGLAGPRDTRPRPRSGGHVLDALFARKLPFPPKDSFDGWCTAPLQTMASLPSPWPIVAIKKRRRIVFAGFSVTRAVFKRITESFQQRWLAKTGEDVDFGLSFAGSGIQSRAIRDGLPAHVCCLALVDDIEKLARGGFIDQAWRMRTPYNGIVARSLTVAGYRPQLDASPSTDKICECFYDILAKNLAVITANPKSAGAARWNFLGLWSAARSGTMRFEPTFIQNALQARDSTKNAILHRMLETENDWIALAFLREVYLRAPVLPRDGRDATDVFLRQELGDVLITYENEAILAQMRGLPLAYSIPSAEANCLIEFPISVVDRNADREKVRDVADAFVEYCFSDEAQQIFADYGFRPVSERVFQQVRERFPSPSILETVDEHYGGWSAVMQKFFVTGAVFDILLEQVSLELLRRRRSQRRWIFGGRRGRGAQQGNIPHHKHANLVMDSDESEQSTNYASMQIPRTNLVVVEYEQQQQQQQRLCRDGISDERCIRAASWLQ